MSKGAPHMGMALDLGHGGSVCTLLKGMLYLQLSSPGRLRGLAS